MCFVILMYNYNSCAWVSLYVSHDYLFINKLAECSLNILQPNMNKHI